MEHALRENERRWESLTEADRERLAAMARAIVSRLLHEPTLRLKRATDDDAAYLHVQALRELFGLDPDAGSGGAGERPPARVTSLDSRRRDARGGRPGSS